MSLWDMRSATNTSSSLCSADASPDPCGPKERFHLFYELFVWMKKSLFNAQQLQSLPLVPVI